MRFHLPRRARDFALGACLLAGLPAQASYSNLYVFGDSLSDTGNLHITTGGALPDASEPYDLGRFSDGPLWIEALAAGLGLAADVAPFLDGGNNYAFAGARVDASDTPPGLRAQIDGLWGATHAQADPDALYVVVGGMNDMRDARSDHDTDAGRQAAAEVAYQELSDDIERLAALGARHILVANLADLGVTPEAVGLGVEAASTDATRRFNLLLDTLVGTLEAAHAGLDVDLLDVFGLSSAIRDDALHNGGGIYGITAVTAPCAGFAGSLGDSCEVSFFSDALHPSARVHALMGNAALAALADAPPAPVPVPGAWWLLVSGVAALTVTARRGAAGSRPPPKAL